MENNDSKEVADINKGSGKSSFGVAHLVIAAVVALIIGGLLGYFIPKTMNAGTPSVEATMTEDQLDDKIAEFTYKGETHDIIARDVIVATASLDSVMVEEGVYKTPSVEMVAAYARDRVLDDEVEKRGLKATEEEAQKYLKEQVGVEDLDTFASYLGIEKDEAQKVLNRGASYAKLRDEVIDAKDIGTAPDAPTPPEEGKEDQATPEYGQYLVALLGDNWDSENETWANEDNEYYEALKDRTFSSESATFDDASVAYYVAYSEYAQGAEEIDRQWTDFTNDLFSGSSITVYTLAS